MTLKSIDARIKAINPVKKWTTPNNFAPKSVNRHVLWCDSEFKAPAQISLKTNYFTNKVAINQ
jgi:hypothetical protein